MKVKIRKQLPKNLTVEQVVPAKCGRNSYDRRSKREELRDLYKEALDELFERKTS